MVRLFRPGYVAHLLCCAALLTALAAGAAPTAVAGVGDTIATLPAARWSIEAPAGDTVTLTAADTCLKVGYSVTVPSARERQGTSVAAGTFRLLLATPVPLKSDVGRIYFEVRGVRCDDLVYREGIKTAVVAPLLREASGETFRYLPVDYPHVKAGTSAWGRRMTRYLYAGEAGGAATGTYEASGGDGNSWPDGELSFVGFEISVRQKPGPYSGELLLGEIATGPMILPPETPWAYADAFATESGDYTLGVAVRNAFQSLPVGEYTRAIHLDADHPDTGRQRLELPLGPDDVYWLDCRTYDAAGRQVACDPQIRWERLGSTVTTPPNPVDPTRPPPAGYLRLNPDAHATGVYQRDEPLAVVACVFSRGKKPLTLTWRLREYAFDVTCAAGQAGVQPGTMAPTDTVISAPWTDGVDAYRLTVSLMDGPVALEVRDYVLGRVTDLEKPYGPRVGLLPDRERIKSRPFIHITYSPSKRNGFHTAFANREEALADFIASLDEMSDATRDITYCTDLEGFTVLPGVYDFALLDAIIDATADRACSLTVRLAPESVPAREPGLNYVKFERQRNYDGVPNVQYYYGGGVALADPNIFATWRDAQLAMGRRYRQHPGFQGYYLMHACGDWGGWLDRPWRAEFVGYERSTLAAFHTYLRETLGLSLDQLNARWHSQYTRWDDVAAPLPSFRRGKTPDLRPQWLDFVHFKAELAGRWFPDLAQAIREQDPNHLIIAYTNNPDGLIGVADYLHNGGNHFLQREGTLMDAWKGGLGWITEPHQPSFWADYGDPRPDGAGGNHGAGWVLDWSTYIMMAQAGGGGANLHVYYTYNIPGHFSLAAHAGGIVALDRMERFRPILRELRTVTIPKPVRQVLILHDRETLYTKHRTTFRSRLEDLRRWFELLKLDGVDYEELRADNQQNAKLLLPNVFDEVMSRGNIDTLARLVNNGARMIMTANTGRYVAEPDSEAFPLLKALGITAPTGEFVLTDANVQARVVAAHPLFDDGSQIRYFTLADMCADLDDPVRQKAFYSSPYRWLPETDYFGYYPDQRQVNGEVLARFPSGGVALSRHPVGKGEVIVFWGTPDFRPEYLHGMMTRAARWAGVVDPRLGNPIPLTLEADSESLNRHYALMYQIDPGEYTQKLPMVADGTYYVDDMVTGEKLGTFTGQELRDTGLPLRFIHGYSPLKVIRMIPFTAMRVPRWLDLYRQPE